MSPILDLSTSLVGRSDELATLDRFLASPDRSVSVVRGRGGIGKSKLLQDWSRTIKGWQVVLLKYAPLWHPESEKEIPTDPTIIVIDDAHRPELEEDIALVVQLFAARRIRQPLKLLFSTRPGASSYFLRHLRRMVSESEIEEFPELSELTDGQSEDLAREVLGEAHAGHARALSDIGGKSPLVIVAGGRLIAAGKVDLALLTSNAEFRKVVFDRFLDELRLEGSDFAINPPRPLLNLIAAIGPVDARSEHFLSGSERFLGATRDEILRTIRVLSERGILSRSEGKVRLLPDVLSDFILEDCCVDVDGPTGYADRVFDIFGPFFFQQLILNLAELDWRVDREYGLRLLESIWGKIEREFLASDQYARRATLEGLVPAAVFQPQRILRLVHLARTAPAAEVDPAYRRLLGDGQKYVMDVVPRLLEAAAHNIEYLQRSMDMLWTISQEDGSYNSSYGSAQNVLKRLASYELNRWVGFNFAVLLHCIRLCSRPEAFETAFTPLDVIDEILEREGEYTEHSGNTVRFGGFGLNYAAIGVMRENAIDFLGTLLDERVDKVAVRAIHSLEHLLHQYLNRVGRQPTKEEVNWQNEERLRCLNLLANRLTRVPLTLAVRSEIYDSIRSATGFNYTEAVRTASTALLPTMSRGCDLAIFDALSRREGDLPLKDRDNPASSWQEDYAALIKEAHDCLAVQDNNQRVLKLVDFVKMARAAGIEIRGFNPIVRSFRDDHEFIASVTDGLSQYQESQSLINELSNALDALHSYAPEEYRRRAWHALGNGPEYLLIAAASALRVSRENATGEDVAIIRAYIDVPILDVKRHALYAIAYMGGNTRILPQLLDAVLSVDIGTDQNLADAFTRAFGPYGVPPSLLNEETSWLVLAKFLAFEDIDIRQGAIPRFVSQLSSIFPDQVLEFMIRRIQTEESHRRNHERHFRALGIDHHAISFMGLPNEKKPEMLRRCLSVRMDLQHSGDSLANLFWSIDPVGDYSFQILAEALESADDEQTAKLKDIVVRSRRPGEQIYGELRRVSAQLTDASKAKSIIEAWCDLSDKRRRDAPPTSDFDPFMDFEN